MIATMTMLYQSAAFGVNLFCPEPPLPEVESRTQGQGRKKNARQRPRTALPKTDPLEAKDTDASALQKKGL